MPRPPCRFLFTDDDAALITASTLQVEDLPLTDDWPLGLKLRFKTTNNARVMVRPLVVCNMRFVADANAPGILPKPDEVAIDDEHYNQWKVVGSLLLELPLATKTLSTLAPNLLVKPNRIWLGPVTITKEFLFDSLIKKNRLARDPVDDIFASDDPIKELKWQQHAISKFLAGVYEPTVALHPTDPTKDDAVRMPMPLVNFNAATSTHELKIFAANAAKPEDAHDDDWDPGLTRQERETLRLEPAHPRNGVIPARVVYQELRTNMVPTATAEAKVIRDRVVEPAPPPAPRAFYPIRFTRSWNPPAANPYDTSIYFPRQEIVFTNPTGAELRRQQLPAHGVLWVDGNFFTNFNVGTRISVDGGDDMRWLPWSADVFMHKGVKTAVPMTNGATPQHIVVRLPMSIAMLEDKSRPLGDPREACTFFSMRRTVRAWLDNRICGGRLSKEVNDNLRKPNSAVTRPETKALFAGTGIRASSVAKNMPDTSMNPADGVRALTPLLVTLFPEDCTQHPIPGVDPPANVLVWPKGRAISYLWQSAQKELKDPTTIRNYSDRDIGRGGAGAIVMLGLGEYHCNESQNSSSDAQFTDQLVGIMMDGNLKPGATTQLWRDWAFYRAIIDRRTGEVNEPARAGHSPIFARYDPETQPFLGISKIDQGGQKSLSVEGVPPGRHISDALVWFAANWTE